MKEKGLSLFFHSCCKIGTYEARLDFSIIIFVFSAVKFCQTQLAFVTSLRAPFCLLVNVGSRPMRQCNDKALALDGPDSRGYY